MYIKILRALLLRVKMQHTINFLYHIIIIVWKSKSDNIIAGGSIDRVLYYRRVFIQQLLLFSQ